VRTVIILNIWLHAVLFGPATTAQTYTVPDEGRAAHKCMYRLRLQGTAKIAEAEFSNDAKTLYLRTDWPIVNVWTILVYLWPELLGGLSAILVLVSLIPLWRLRRRPRIVGAPHCRNCNYCVRGVESGICPECGRPIRRPIIGRPLRRRIAVPVTLLAVVVLGYGGLWALRLPRWGSASHWLHWWSISAAEVAKRLDYPYIDFVMSRTRILEVDVQMGQLRRELLTGGGASRMGGFLQPVPGGQTLIVTFGPYDLPTLVDLRSGRIHRRLELPEALLSKWRPRRNAAAEVGPGLGEGRGVAVDRHGFGSIRKLHALGTASALPHTALESAEVPGAAQRRLHVRRRTAERATCT
jgi:hypothetical protein